MTPADVSRMIGQAEAAGAGHLVALLAPVMRGEMNIIAPLRDTVQPPFWRLGKQGRPVLVLIGDDDYRPAGPSTWTCAAKLRNWASFAIIHGAAAERGHYDMAACMAQDVRRLLFIETTSAAAQEWAGFLQQRADLKFMGMLPGEGARPVMPARGAVH